MTFITLRYDNEINFYLSAIKNTKLIAVTIIFLTTVTAYSIPSSYPLIYMTMIPLLVLQLFTSLNYHNLLKKKKISHSKRNRINSCEINMPVIFAVGLAVKEGFFLIFLCFDIIWLLGAYITPEPAYSFSEYVSRLRIGPITGDGFVIFTLFFWLIYLVLYFIGSYIKDEMVDDTLPDVKKISRIDFAIKVNNYNNELININGLRISNPSRQPLILFPGFFQNGFFYDILPGDTSIAEFLWKQGYDIWIFHPRGTENSKYSKKFNSIDDLACEDIPLIIDFVLKNSGKKPIFIGHSQGGISALVSLMGASKTSGGEVFLSEEESSKRQDKLRGLVTLGSYLNFSFSKPSTLQNFVRNGLTLSVFKKKIKIVSSNFLLNLLSVFNRIPVPVPFALRIVLLKSKSLRIVLFPLTLLLNIVSLLGVWQFLYNIPNVSKKSRIYLFYKTIDASFRDILAQFHHTIMNERMFSRDNKVNYSDNYFRIKLPVSVVTMEFDTLADPVETKKVMFQELGSKEKYYTEWMGQGHEDFVMNSDYFHQLSDAIKILNTK